MEYTYQLLSPNTVLVTFEGKETAHVVEPEVFRLLTCLQDYQQTASGFLAPLSKIWESEEDAHWDNYAPNNTTTL